jgi:hypothetical protein
MLAALQRYRMISSSKGTRNRVGCLGAAIFLCLLVFVALDGPALAEPPSAPVPGTYVTDGPVHAIARAGGRTFIGGDFSRVGRRTGSGAVLTGAGASKVYPEVSGGDVHAAVSDGAGGWFVGGTFTSVGGQPHGGLAHIHADQTVDQGFNPAVTDSQGAPAVVNALALSPPDPNGASTLYVAGRFSRIGVEIGRAHV